MEAIISTLSARMLTTNDDLRAAADRWRALAEAAGSPFATPEWCECVLRCDPSARPAVVAVHDGDRLVALLPLIHRRRGPVRILRFPGDDLGDTYPFMLAPGVNASDAAFVAGRALAESPLPWDVLLLFGADGDATWIEQLAAAAHCTIRDRGDLMRPGIPECPPDGWEGLLAGMKRGNRKEARRRLRRNETQPGARWEMVDDPGRARDGVATLFRLHDMRWTTKGGSSLDDDRHRTVLADFAEASARRGWLRLWMQTVDETPVAAELAWRVGDRQTHYQGGFDPAWSHLGVGLAVFHHAMRVAMEQGVTDIDMGQGDARYKVRYSTAVRRSRRVVLTRTLHPAGLAAGGALSARRMVLRTLERDDSGVTGRLIRRLTGRGGAPAPEDPEDGGGDV